MVSLGDIFDNATETSGRKVSDDSIKENAEFQSNSGLEVRVTRTYDEVGLSNGRECLFCKERECRNYTLSQAYDIGAFQRHDGCGCIIEYTSAKGEKTVQTGKSGRSGWITVEEFRERVDYGLDGRKITPQERMINAAIEMQVRDKRSTTLADAIIDNHEALRYYSPKQLKERMERAGYKIEPLGSKSKHIPGIPFDQGGGYRVFFGGDGYLQYHPEGGRHKIAYWKISNGERRVHKYDLEGKEVFF